MAMRFPYQLISVGYSVLTLGGRWVRPRPIIGVTLVGPADSRLKEAAVDPAADETIFPERHAAQIGIDLTNAPQGIGRGVGLAAIPLRYAEVTLRITDGHESREWKGWVGFTPARLYRPLLGFAGCLQFFSADFHGDREFLDLTVNSLYPGT